MLSYRATCEGDIVADLLKVSPSQVARYESINNHLSPELTEEFRKEEINVTTAFELSRLDETQQAEALEEHKSGVMLTPDSVKEKRETAKKPPKKTPDSTEPEAEATKPYIDASAEERHRRNEHDAEKYINLHEQNKAAETSAPKPEQKLKPCPFCGGEPFINEIEPHKHYFVDMPDYEGGAFMECTDCSCGISAKTRKEVIAAWNKRI